MQMYLNGGEYAGKRYIEEKTIEEFTSCQYRRKDNRRGIGFDKPVIDDTADLLAIKLLHLALDTLVLQEPLYGQTQNMN